MRFLLTSDTHGKLGIINELVDETQVDAVIHAGDFGFYDYESYERLSERELRLHITHSELSTEERERILNLPDAHVGYAVLDAENESTAIQTNVSSEGLFCASQTLLHGGL